MKPLISLRTALGSDDLFRPLLGGDSWRAWRVMLIAAMGEALDDDELALFRSLTGRETAPTSRVETLVGVIGRRGGKNRAAAVLAAYIAALCDHSDKIAPGERPMVLCLAANTRQAAISFDYISAIFDEVPALRGLVKGRTSDTLALTNGVTIEVRPASFRGVRGVTCLAVIADECAFWQVEGTSENPDTAILAAVRPSLATTAGMLVLISSPHAKRGELFELWRRHYGPQGDPLTLICQGESRRFNPTLPQSVVDRALEADPEAAAAEYLAQWRTDVAAYVDRRVVEAAIVPNRFELPRLDGPRVRYHAFCDPAGGSGADSMTLAVCHREGGKVIVDLLREARPRFSPEAVVAEFVDVLATYGLRTVTGDRFAGQFCQEQFVKRGVHYRVSERTKSEIYKDFLAILNASKVELLDHRRLASQLCGLERIVSRGGRDTVDHSRGGHDDVANAVAGASVLAHAASELPFMPFLRFSWT
jgi:hypothetical protein